MGCSRHTFYPYQDIYEQGGEEALLDISRQKPILKNRTATEVENVVREITMEKPEGE